MSYFGHDPLSCSEKVHTHVRFLVGHTLAHIERELILQTLASNRGNRTNTAASLGISVRCLRYKIQLYKRHGAQVPDPQNASVMVSRYLSADSAGTRIPNKCEHPPKT
jgi:hypothetical protein